MNDDGSDALDTGPAPGAGRLRSALGRWGPPLGLALLIVATAPYVGVLREAVQGRFGLGYLRWVTGALALVAAAALAWAVVRIRERRALRYGALALAAALVALQVAFWTTGAAEADMVERVHLAEYGLLAILFARALRPRHDDRLLPVLALLALALASLADEGVQWLTPVRVGDGRDVLLNLWAGVVGLLFGLALAPPRGLLRPSGERSRRLAAGLGATAVLAGALFWDLAHLGHEIHDPRSGVFLSWHS
ncbi:MAG TPA: VanZ family protein, partial [Thermoanaerobaculia bacterium]|nr:VanZ family protein [Thermoanaerobaculia bacterium]